MRTFAIVVALSALAAACGSPASGPVVSSSTSAVYDAATAAEARWIPGSPLALDVEVELVDPYDNESAARALEFTWSRAELDRVNRENADGYILINLASVTIRSPYGVMALAEWCDDTGRSLTPRLCGPTRAKAENDWVEQLARQDAARTAGSTEPPTPGSAP